MELRHICLSGAILSALMLAGCGNDNTPGTSSPNSQTTTSPPAGASGGASPGGGTAQPAEPGGNTAVEPAPGTSGMPTTPAAPTTMPDMNQMPPTTQAGDAQARANTLLQQGIQYVKENRVDLANKTVDELEQMKPNLPASYGPRIDQLKAMVSGAQMKNGNLPGGVKLPGQ